MMQPNPVDSPELPELARGAAADGAPDGAAAAAAAADGRAPGEGLVGPVRVDVVPGRPLPGAATPVAGEANATPGPTDPYQLLRRALRGRYGRAIVFAVVGAALGAVAAWQVARPGYRSEALVRVANWLPVIEKPTDQNGQMSGYEAFMQTQEAILSSYPTVSDALRRPAWQALGRGSSPADVQEFISEMQVSRAAGTEHIRVIYQDLDPVAAATGVNAVVDAYVSSFEQNAEQFEKDRLKVLEDDRQTRQRDFDALMARMRTIAEPYSAASLEPLHRAAAERAAKLESQMMEMRLTYSLAQAARGAAAAAVPAPSLGHPATQPSAAASAEAPKRLATAEVARLDPETWELFVAQRQLANELNDATKVRGLGEGHPEVVRLKARLELATQQLERRADEYRQTEAIRGRYVGGVRDALVSGAQPSPPPADVVRADIDSLNKFLEDAKRDVALMSAKIAELAPYRLQADRMRGELDATADRIATLERERKVGGRVKVLSEGQVNRTPFYDPRKKFVAAGAVGGACIPVGALLLLGTLNRRYRFSDEAASDVAGSAPLLGILPALSERLDSPERASEAAQCIHQIRATLQVNRMGQRQPRTYLVTSATAGEGKSSVALALGLSFAACGERTLVIDCDIVGQRVTRGLRAEGLSGLRQAMAAGTMRGCVRKTDSGLFVLTSGTSDVLDAFSISSVGIRRLLVEVRRYFDTVVIDSGPILGSVEAMAVAPEVDGVIFTVSRGQEPPMVERALAQLRSIGGTVTGFVFNRAHAKDFSRSAGSSLRSVASDDLAGRALLTDPGNWQRFGPIVQAVAAFLPRPRDPGAALAAG